MTGLALDCVLALLIVAIGCWTILVASDFAAVVGFVAFGLFLTLAWVRLEAFDVALIEAAIGSGLTGALLLRAAAQTEVIAPGRTKRTGAAIVCGCISTALAAVVVSLDPEGPTLAPLAMANAGATGLGNPVTNVLMAFRAIDTLLEKVVLLIALVGVWSLARDARWGARPDFGYGSPPNALTFLAKTLPPLGIVVGIYLLWTSADNPGGAFQGGTVLATMWLLTMWARLSVLPRTDGRTLRLGLILGPSIFLGVGLAVAMAGAPFLSFPPDFAKPLILAIEFAMTLTIAITLGLLMAGPAKTP